MKLIKIDEALAGVGYKFVDSQDIKDVIKAKKPSWRFESKFETIKWLVQGLEKYVIN
ncbi:hypothetical protein [Metamycoplasma canadense]|uniref:hypothetical protein n=1 Tax=Metamycoplasma canadense TaxID=29554 RepID=UPI000A55E5A5|nr:hypothetical protein [Metamycoplasma canadense]